MATDIRAEANNLLGEVRVLSSQNEKCNKENQELKQQVESQKQIIEDLEQQVLLLILLSLW